MADAPYKHITGSSPSPAPWWVSGCMMGHNLLIEHGDSETKNPLIAEVYALDEVHGFGIRNANAALMAAAPELLDALKGLQRAIREAGLLNVKKHFDLCVYDAAAGKAIAKAEGR